MKYRLVVGHESFSSKTGYERNEQEFDAVDDKDAVTKAEALSPSVARGFEIDDRQLYQGERLVKEWDS